MCEISPVIKQFITIICCNLLTISFGWADGWATVNFNEFQNANSTYIQKPLTLEQSSFVISVLNIGAIIGNFAILPIGQCIGMKRTIHLFGLPIILSTLLAIWPQNVYYLYASRFLTGFVGGAAVVGIPVLINDISYDSVRGTLNSIFDPSYNIGFILSLLLGDYFNCMDQAKIQLIVPIVFTIILILVPESPEFWTRQNKEKRAMKSLKYYKGSVSTLENAEFLPKPLKADDETENAKNENGNSVNCRVENGSPDAVEPDVLKLTVKDFLTPQAKKALLLSFSAIFVSCMSGVYVMASYVTDIFTKTGSPMSVNNSALLMIVIQIFGNLIFLNIVDRINRRVLFIWSSILTGLGYFAFGMYCLWCLEMPEYKWMAPFWFGCVTFFSCMGLVPIPYVLTIEIFPKKIQQACLAIEISMIWIVLFVLCDIFPIYLEAVGLFVCLISLGVMCLLSAIFGFFCLPETRNKSYEEIMEILNK